MIVGSPENKNIGLASDVTLQARNLTKVYVTGDVEVHALRGVDLDLYSGEMMVLLGASGSGKSTLLNIVGGLDVPTSGSVIFRDFELTRANTGELTQFRRAHVGFVFQFFTVCSFSFRVLVKNVVSNKTVKFFTEKMFK